jgi:hypothetical protein
MGPDVLNAVAGIRNGAPFVFESRQILPPARPTLPQMILVAGLKINVLGQPGKVPEEPGDE